MLKINTKYSKERLLKIVLNIYLLNISNYDLNLYRMLFLLNKEMYLHFLNKLYTKQPKISKNLQIQFYLNSK